MVYLLLAATAALLAVAAARTFLFSPPRPPYYSPLSGESHLDPYPPRRGSCARGGWDGREDEGGGRRLLGGYHHRHRLPLWREGP